MLNSGTILKERYSIIGLLGRGGMGEVYLAEDISLSRTVAVKRVLYSDNEDLFKAAEKEAKVLGRLQHPNLPKVLDYFSENPTQYIVMEYISGKDLCKILENNKAPFSTEQVLIWLGILLDILEYLHHQMPPVVHRDIKPQNIKITDEGKLILIDFGLVKDTPTRAAGTGSSKSTFGYSESYAPLEQINGDATSVQTDIYGLCATLYHLLTNIKPPDALNRATKMIERKPDPLRPAHEVNSNIPLSFSQVIESGLRLNCEDRIKSVSELRQLLIEDENTRHQVRSNHGRINININDSANNENKKEIKPISAQPDSASRKWKLYAAISMAVVVLALGGFMIYQWINKPEAEAAKIRDEAEKIERSEGLLNSIACSKYQEIQTKYGQTSIAKETVGKANACTNAQSLLEQTEKKEKEKGLTYETVESYKKIIETYPNSTNAKQAEKRVAEFEKNKQATLQAWKEMQKIDNDADVSSEQYEEQRTKWGRLINNYEIISLENVDPILVEHIKKSIAVYREARTAIERRIEEGNTSEQKKESIMQQCKNDYYNTDTTVMPQTCYEEWVKTEYSKLEEDYNKQTALIKGKIDALAATDKSISSQLYSKYKAEFNDL